MINPPQKVSANRAAGFTLVELIAGMAVTLTVSALALQALSNSQQSFTADRNAIENGQRLSSVLDMVSRDIRQAGEQIGEASFAAIQVVPDSVRGSRLVVYRALTEPLPVCGLAANVSLPAGSTALITSDPDAAFLTPTPPPATCRPDNIIAPATFPVRHQEWVTRRAQAPGNALFGIAHDLRGGLTPFVYSGEAVTADRVVTLQSRIATNMALPRESSLYLIEKREYLICGNELKVWINSSQTGCATNPAITNPAFESFQTVANGVERMDITVSTRTRPVTLLPTDPDVISALPTNASFPPPAILSPTNSTTWQNIQGLSVRLRSRDPNGKEYSALSPAEQAKLVVEGKFYPRNILSVKRAQ
jgi:type II secretory pathway pseudopilin PulG